MIYKVAAVSFTNTLPLVDSLTHRHAEDVLLSWHLPSQLAETLHTGTADVALLPVVELFHGEGAGIVPGIGIASSGPVGSVMLFSKVAPAAIEQVIVDRASRTSVALLRILLAELYGIQPDFHAREPRPENLFQESEAALVIGDRCFAVQERLRREEAEGIHMFDLAELWRHWTELPFVFAVWCLGSSFVARATTPERMHLCQLLTRARDEGLENLDTLAARAAQAGNLGHGGEATPEALRYYFRQSLQYVIGEREMAGLQRFYELCLQYAICPAGNAPSLAAAGKGE